GERMTFRVGALDELRIGARHAADHEERRLHAFDGEDVEHAAAVGRQRAVVESDDDFAVVERQRFPILEGAEKLVLGRIDRDGAAGSERARIAATIGCFGWPRRDEGQQTVSDELDSHAPRRTPTPLTQTPDLRPGSRVDLHSSQTLGTGNLMTYLNVNPDDNNPTLWLRRHASPHCHPHFDAGAGVRSGGTACGTEQPGALSARRKAGSMAAVCACVS